MSRDFNPLAPSIWSSPRFFDLPDSDARLLALYCIGGPHQTSAGCFRAKPGYVMADLGWPRAQYEAALDAIVTAGIVLHDPATDEIYVLRWFTHKGNVPTNKDHAKGARKVIEKIDSPQLRAKAEEDFRATEWGARAWPSPDEEADNPLDRPAWGTRSALENSRLVRGVR